MSEKRIQFIVSLTLPSDTTDKEAKDYISEAIRQYRSVNETGLMSSLDPDSVFVIKVRTGHQLPGY